VDNLRPIRTVFFCGHPVTPNPSRNLRRRWNIVTAAGAPAAFLADLLNRDVAPLLHGSFIDTVAVDLFAAPPRSPGWPGS
jgi:hypothetical protein